MICKICNQDKHISEIRKDKRYIKMLSTICESCYISRKRERSKISKQIERSTDKYKEQYRAFSYKKLYGISISDFDKMLLKQNNKCAICETNNPGKNNWSVDHCHNTHKVRGILCNKCNLTLGLFNDDIKKFKNAINYLEDAIKNM